MKSRHIEPLADLLDQTAMGYVNHQEDDLGVPVQQQEYFWGIGKHFVRTLVATAARAPDPAGFVTQIVAEVQAYAFELLEAWDQDDEADEDDADDA